VRQMAIFEGADTHYRQKVYRVQVVRLQLVREASLSCYAKTITTAADVAELVRPMLQGADREHFLAIMLDTKNKVNAIHTVSVGTLNASLVHPREVFKVALLTNAASVILCHNHPSGDPTPSKEDRDTTMRLVQVGKLLGIEVLDHVIIGEGRFFACKQAGLL